MKHKGFTIAELLVVIVAIAILATLSFVGYQGLRERALDSAAAKSVHDAGKSISLYYAQTGVYPRSHSQLRAYSEELTLAFSKSLTSAITWCGRTDMMGFVVSMRNGKSFSWNSVDNHVLQHNAGVSSGCGKTLNHMNVFWTSSASLCPHPGTRSANGWCDMSARDKGVGMVVIYGIPVPTDGNIDWQ